MSKVSMNPFVPLNSYGVGTLFVGLQLIRHHDEAIVARCSPILDILQHRGFVGHPLKALQLDLGRLAAVECGMGLIFVEGPGVDIALGSLE